MITRFFALLLITTLSSSHSSHHQRQGHIDRQGDHVVAAKLNPVIEQMKLSRFSGGNMVETRQYTQSQKPHSGDTNIL